MKKILILVILTWFSLQATLAQSVMSIGESEFKSLIWDFEAEKAWKYKGNKPAIIDFYADWCAPCRALMPHLESIQADYGRQLQVYKINTDKNPALTRLFSIRTIPTLIFVDPSGKKVEVKGAHNKKSLKDLIRRYFSLD